MYTSYTASPPGYPDMLCLLSSKLNLTAYDGNYAGPEGQTLIARRQMDTLFTYGINMDFSPGGEEEEAGVTVFLTQVRTSALCQDQWSYTDVRGVRGDRTTTSIWDWSSCHTRTRART